MMKSERGVLDGLPLYTSYTLQPVVSPLQFSNAIHSRGFRETIARKALRTDFNVAPVLRFVINAVELTDEVTEKKGKR